MQNFIADVRKGGDFSKSYWTKRSRKQVAFFHVRTVKHLHLQTAGVTVSFKTLGLSRLSRMVSYTCKLRGNTSHSERLITLAGLASSTEVTFIPVLHEPGQPGAAIPNTHNKRHIRPYNDAKIYAPAASCLLDRNNPRTTTQYKCKH